jgi:cellulose synthase/poly-beta-1,6-N-acetylglucosamine synthase-like glycosyltransferase
VIEYLFGCTAILLLIYALLIFYYHRIWDRIPVATPDHDLPPVRVAVIIPARNEDANIEKCLLSLFNQSYPIAYTEIIVVNDFSTDQTAAIVSKYSDRCKLLNLSDFLGDAVNSYKKKAIETGIARSTAELIICTDADCTMGKDWIEGLVSAHLHDNKVFIAAPVKIIPDGSALSVFQTLDFISLQGITGAAASGNLYPMCNGANLAYTKTAFDAVDGFNGIDHIASGDDMLLMGKIQSSFPGRIGYLKDPRVIVCTSSVSGIRAFFNQRIRWASKVSHYRHRFTFLTLAVVYLLNVLLLGLFFVSIFYGHWKWFLLLLFCKTLSEYFFVSKVAAFFGQQSLMKYFILCQPFHILYTVIAGSFGSFGRYEWKNRMVK